MTATTAVRLFIVAFAIAAGAGSHLAGADMPIATVGLTPGWATFGEAVPQGLATGVLQVGSFPTQTDVKNRWPDGSIKFAVVSAHVSTAGNYPVTPSAAAGGSFTPIVPAASVTVPSAGTAYVPTLPRNPGADVWLDGGEVREWRSGVAPAAGAAPHPYLRVIFDTRVFRDGKA